MTVGVESSVMTLGSSWARATLGANSKSPNAAAATAATGPIRNQE
jgi:hypothetical protein